MSTTSRTIIGLGCACVLAVANGGCANTPLDESTSPPVAAQVQTLLAPDPDVPYFAEVIANGTGCPPGSWTTTISDDGTTFSTTFSAYEALVEPTKLVQLKDCQLGIKLHSPQGLSFSVESFFYQGSAFLETGVTGRQTAQYWFMGDPVDAVSGRTDLVGFYDDDYLFQDDVPLADLVWSDCGRDRDLQVATRLRVLNNRAKTGTGYMNLLSVEGNATLVFKLSWRSC